ncbi:MAG: cytidine deaminase [Oscillospiraceae bacterium]|nr:cytidine deaminase [Oscillospiraceae bacterium]
MQTAADLYRAAADARRYSHSPYSHFSVGAAIIAENAEGGRRVFTGCNVENASYGGAICAERTAAVKAVSEGYTRFTAVAVSGGYAGEDEQDDTFPCGICLQFLSEFASDDMTVTLRSGTYAFGELFPNAFRL